MIENSLWAEKYRPKSLEHYVASDELKNMMEMWVKGNEIPHLLLYSPDPGTGKTSLAKLISSLIDATVLYINASSENNIDTVREKITNFVSSAAFTKWKIVILDEADFCTVNAQGALRNLMETFSKSSRFILTCNYIERIIPPIASRCTKEKIIPPSKKAVAKNITRILDLEGIKYNIKDVVEIINRYYPDQRAVINYCQNHSLTGELVLSNFLTSSNKYFDNILVELKNVKDIKQTFVNIRQILSDSGIRQFDELFRYLYDNLDDWTPEGKKAIMILTLAEFQYKISFVVDKEITIMAMFVTILQNLK